MAKAAKYTCALQSCQKEYESRVVQYFLSLAKWFELRLDIVPLVLLQRMLPDVLIPKTLMLGT